MIDQVWISGPSRRHTNPVTGAVETVPGVPKYGTVTDPGIGVVQVVGQGEAVELIIGGQPVSLSTYAVKVPAATIAADVGDEVHVVTSHDSALDGLTLIVAEPTAGNTYAIQRRLVCTMNLG